MDKTAFCPKRGHDECVAFRRLHGAIEILILPCVDRSAVDRLHVDEDIGDLVDGRLVATRLHVHGREHDWHFVELCDPGKRCDIGDQLALWTGGDRRYLDGLEVYDDYGG